MQFPLSIEALFYRDADRSYAIDEHVHFEHQWYCVVRGDVETIVEGSPLRLGDQTSVIIPPRVTRAPRCVGRAPSYIVAIFKNEGLGLGGLELKPLATPLELRPDLLALASELQRPGGGDSELFAHTLLLRLLLGLSRANQPERARGLADHALISRIEAFLQTNLHRPLTRDDVARAVHLSPPHLARVYRSLAGKTLGRRLTELRIERAKQLLSGSTMAITQIAGEVGLSSFSHFTKVFRHEVGVAPSAWRARSTSAQSRTKSSR